MNNCGHYEKLMDRLLDGELTPAEDAELQAHVRACPDCQVRLDALLAIQDILSGDMAEPPAALAAGVMDRIRAEENNNNVVPIARARKRPVWRHWAVAACLAVVIGSGALAAVRGGLRSSAARMDIPPVATPMTVSQEFTVSGSDAAVSRGAEQQTENKDQAPAGAAEAASDVAAPDEIPAQTIEADQEVQPVEAPNAGAAMDTIPTEAPSLPAQEAPPQPMPEQTAEPARELPPQPMPEDTPMTVAAAAEDGPMVVSSAPDEGGDAPSMARMTALPVYDPDGEFLGVIQDPDALDELLTAADLQPDGLQDVEWDVLCTLEYGEDTYTFAADEGQETLVWWTDDEPAPTLSPGVPADLLDLIG